MSHDCFAHCFSFAIIIKFIFRGTRGVPAVDFPGSPLQMMPKGIRPSGSWKMQELLLSTTDCPDIPSRRSWHSTMRFLVHRKSEDFLHRSFLDAIAKLLHLQNSYFMYLHIFKFYILFYKFILYRVYLYFSQTKQYVCYVTISLSRRRDYEQRAGVYRDRRVTEAARAERIFVSDPITRTRAYRRAKHTPSRTPARIYPREHNAGRPSDPWAFWTQLSHLN